MKREIIIDRILKESEKFEPIRQRVHNFVFHSDFIRDRGKLEAVLSGLSDEQVKDILTEVRQTGKNFERAEKLFGYDPSVLARSNAPVLGTSDTPTVDRS